MATEPDNGQPGIVMVSRCRDMPKPYVPSVHVLCVWCGVRCWMTKSMQDNTPKESKPICQICLPDLMTSVAKAGGSLTPEIPPKVMDEFRRYMQKTKSANDN